MANREFSWNQSHPLGQRLAVWGALASAMVLPVLGHDLISATARDPSDFLFLAFLLAGAGAAYELAARIDDRRAYRAALGVAIVASLLQAWINLAVGIIGSEDSPANLIYAGVIAVALGGAIAARLRPDGMALAMVATAAAQLVAFVAALTAGLGFTGPITVFFCTMWLVSAWLFRRAARRASIDNGLNNKEATQ